jgi:hypothetical protein
MTSSYDPFGYKEMTLIEQKKSEYLIARLLEVYKQEKQESFSDSEIKFLSIFLYYFRTKQVKTRDLMNKMYSHALTNYKILNHLIKLNIIFQVQRGVYKLNDKVLDVLSKIQLEIQR